jgi:uncharacterized membrane protein YjjP (DUF1212 family)/uncharacterized membrane protein YjjB (DUF3815 family)
MDTAAGTTLSADERAVLLKFLAKLGQMELAGGNAVPFVERDIVLIARQLGLAHVSAFVLPTGLFIEVDDAEGHKLDLATGPYRSGQLRMDQIEEVLVIAREARMGRIKPERGLERLEAVQRMRHRYGDIGFALGYLVTTVGVAFMLRPSLQGLGVVAVLALLCAGLLLMVRKRPAWAVIMPVVASFTLSAAVALGYRFGLKEPAMTLLIPPLITFLPGMMLTVSVIELAYANVISGASRMVAGFAQLILLAFGILGGFKAFPFPVSGDVPTPLFARLGPWVPWIGVLVFAIGLHVYQSSKPRSFGFMLLTAIVAYGAQTIAGQFLHGGSTAFFGAAAMTIVALVIEFRFNGPPAIVTFLPGFWLLAPGSFGLISVASMATGSSTAEDLLAFLFALTGIATGCLIGAFTYSALLHPRHIRWWAIEEHAP